MKNKLVKRRTEHKYYARRFGGFWLIVAVAMITLYQMFGTVYFLYLGIATVSCAGCMNLTWAYYAARENIVKRRSNVTEQSGKA